MIKTRAAQIIIHAVSPLFIVRPPVKNSDNSYEQVIINIRAKICHILYVNDNIIKYMQYCFKGDQKGRYEAVIYI